MIKVQARAEFIQLICLLLNFSYLAHSVQLTDVDLTEMDKTLVAFHKAKHVLVEEKIYADNSAFDRIAELHMLGHYTNNICELGTPDGYSTETPEHLHILYVKLPWRMSNQQNPIPQMVTYVQHLEAIQLQHVLMDKYYGECLNADEEELWMNTKDEDDEAEPKSETNTTQGAMSIIGVTLTRMPDMTMRTRMRTQRSSKRQRRRSQE
ncbi:hypothetical protein FRC06_004191 [Ceratobasidium sp. 370]|nr:hypothetical protein FRC06_004191 [Ceratobasidium sp. 370]